MKAKLILHRCIVTLAPGERVKNESDLFFKLKKVLNFQQGYDMVKKPPAKDGHLVGAPYYLRDRKGRFMVHDSDYAIRDAAKALNTDRKLALWVYGDICKPKSAPDSSSKASPARARTGRASTAPSGL